MLTGSKTTSHTDLSHCAVEVTCITYRQIMGLGSLSILGSFSNDCVRAKSGVFIKWLCQSRNRCFQCVAVFGIQGEGFCVFILIASLPSNTVSSWLIMTFSEIACLMNPNVLLLFPACNGKVYDHQQAHHHNHTTRFAGLPCITTKVMVAEHIQMS